MGDKRLFAAAIAAAFAAGAVADRLVSPAAGLSFRRGSVCLVDNGDVQLQTILVDDQGKPTGATRGFNVTPNGKVYANTSADSIADAPAVITAAQALSAAADTLVTQISAIQVPDGG